MNKKESKPILLVPVDFKVYCLKALDYAKKLQKEIGAKIHLIHVIESQLWWENYFNTQDLKTAANEKLQALIKEEGLDSDTGTEVLTGKSHTEIVALAEKLKARYIILSDNYPLTKVNKVLGSTLSQVVIKAVQPVISITDKEDSIFKNVLVPIDLSQTSRNQLYKSVAMALNYGSKIHLVSVLFGYENEGSSGIYQKVEKYRQVYEENGIDYEIKLLKKEEKLAYKEIINYSNNNHIDTILMMTHNEAASFNNYLGAFAQRIINEATVPVITINKVSSHRVEQSKLKEIIDPLNVLSD